MSNETWHPPGTYFPQEFFRATAAPDGIQDVVVDGRNVFAFTLKDGDVLTWDSGNIGPGGKANQRVEVMYESPAGGDKWNSPYNVDETVGNRVYYFDFKFDSNFVLDQRWATLLQFHGDDAAPGMFHFGGIAIHNNSIDFEVPGRENIYFAQISIQTRDWYKLRLEINWTSKADGYVVVYNNDQVVGRYDGPTIRGSFAYLKQGYYRDGSVSARCTVYQTPVAIGGTGKPYARATDQLNAPQTPVVTPPVSTMPEPGAQNLADLCVYLEKVLPQLDSTADRLNQEALSLTSAATALTTAASNLTAASEEGKKLLATTVARLDKGPNWNK